MYPVQADQATDFDPAIELDPSDDDYVAERAKTLQLMGRCGVEPTVLQTAREYALTSADIITAACFGTHLAQTPASMPA
jgi:hypothetical protein